MNSTFEGDLVRPLGLVTLYFAYAEGEIDELLESLSVIDSFDEPKRQWTVGRKLAHAQELIDNLHSDKLVELKAVLDEARILFEKRNTFVHSRIFAGGRVVSSRSDLQSSRVTPEELTELAQQIFSCKELISVRRQKLLEPLLASLENPG